MISVFVYDRNRDEAAFIEEQLRFLTACSTDETLSFCVPAKGRNEDASGIGRRSFDVAVIDVSCSFGIKTAETVRASSPAAQMMVIADRKISPLKYLVPSIRPSSLLLRPYTANERNMLVGDFFRKAVMPVIRKDAPCFWTKSREGSERIPYDEICYFEAMKKKIIVHTAGTKYCSSGAIGELEESLPRRFVRCHRSFIVNSDYIEAIVLKDNIAHLKGNQDVPVSRSYKSRMKEFIDEGIYQ